MEWIHILAGLAVLFFGRRLFWLFVGCVGFIVGFDLAGRALAGQSEWLILFIAVGVGLISAIASVFLQRIFIVVAGFFAGAYCLSTFVPGALHLQDRATMWIAFVVGGLLGAMLTAVLLDPALIVMSSLAGATAISQNVPLDPSGRTLLFVVLLVLGIAVQTRQFVREPKPEHSQPPK